MKAILSLATFLAFTVSTQAAGWVYMDGPWLYDPAANLWGQERGWTYLQGNRYQQLWTYNLKSRQWSMIYAEPATAPTSIRTSRLTLRYDDGEVVALYFRNYSDLDISIGALFLQAVYFYDRTGLGQATVNYSGLLIGAETSFAYKGKIILTFTSSSTGTFTESSSFTEQGEEETVEHDSGAFNYFR